MGAISRIPRSDDLLLPAPISIYYFLRFAPYLRTSVKYLDTKNGFRSISREVLQGGHVKGFLKWFGNALAHAMGAIDAEEKSHIPPPIGMSPYRDRPTKGTHDYWDYA